MSMTMQFAAIIAAIGWSLVQIFHLFLAMQCIFCQIEFRSTPEIKLYQKVLSNSIIYLFSSLYIWPFISVGLFYYGVFNISGWYEIKPALWTCAIWWISLILALSLLSVKEKYRI